MEISPELIKQFIIALNLGPQAEAMLNSMFGSNALGLSWLYTDPTKTVGFNQQAQIRSAQMQGMFGGSLQAGANTARQALISNIYQLLGKDVLQARDSARANTPLTGLIDQLMVMPKVMQSYSSMANALYNERRYFDPSYTGYVYGAGAARTSQGYQNYKALGNQLIQGVIESAATGGMAGMSIEDSGSVAAAYIKAGNLTAGQTGLGDSGTPKNIKSRIEAVKKELNDYAASINQLRDVINGPVEKILQDFEKMTGNSMMSMSRGRVATMASAMQTAIASGISKEEIGGATVLQLSMIKALGGNMGLASAMGTVNALGIGNSHEIEGLTKGDFAAAQSRYNARTMLNGGYRKAAAAYVSWLSSEKDEYGERRYKEDTIEAKQAFMAQMTANGQSFNTGVQNWLAKTGLANNATFMQSAMVSAAQNDPFFIAQVNADDIVGRYKAERERIIGGLTGLRSAAAAEVIRSTYNPAKIQEGLKRVGYSDEQAALVARQLSSAAILATNEADPLAAARLVEAAQGSVEAQKKAQDNLLWTKTRGQLIGGGGGSALERVINTMMKDTGSMTFRRLVGTAVGLDQTQINQITSEGISKESLAQLMGKGNLETIEGLAQMGNLGSQILFAGARDGRTQADAFKDIKNIVGSLRKGGPLAMGEIEAMSQSAAISEDQKIAIYLAANKRGGLKEENGKPIALEEIKEGEISDFKAQRAVEEARFNATETGKASARALGILQTAIDAEKDPEKKKQLEEQYKVQAGATSNAINRMALARHNIKAAISQYKAKHQGSAEGMENDAEIKAAVAAYEKETGLKLDAKEQSKLLESINKPTNLQEFFSEVIDKLTILINKIKG